METITAFIKTHPQSLTLLGLALLIRFWVNRRRFNRRGWGGMQHFTSYGKALFTTAIEKILMLIAGVMMVAAILLLLTGH
ncbi:hypothetical protein GR160_07715 [Flavobacterium sp. Sd200]|uniref:hypothetical protein n=1 Tax=Flavobacterium sp. Sd200 TaxID=2692211 RepID=UPI001367F29C|nr:hypothetical protein [Flavobacterium sp. Sd200]MXN91115.1 hypothetical protein [Flavobacterium sp. Sd200]